jgi:hypothetical protein
MTALIRVGVDLVVMTQVPATRFGRCLSKQYARPATRMVRRYQRWIGNGIDSLRMTGKKGSYNLLVLYKLIWPHSTNLECIAFIANNSTDGRIYNEKDISKALL